MRCPISKYIYLDPVITSDGITYERDCIEEWFKTQTTSPLTGLNITKRLIPNIMVRQLVADHLTKNPDQKSEQYVIKYSISKYEKKFSDAVCSSDWSIVMKFDDFIIHTDSQYSLIQTCFNSGNNDVIDHIIEKSRFNNPQLIYIAASSKSPYPLNTLLNKEDIKELGFSYIYDIEKNSSPLRNAISFGHTDNVKLLIERGLIKEYPQLYNANLVVALYTCDYEKISIMINIDCCCINYLLSDKLKEVLNKRYHVSHTNIIDAVIESKLADERKIEISNTLQKKLRLNIKRKIAEINVDEEPIESMFEKVRKIQ